MTFSITVMAHLTRIDNLNAVCDVLDKQDASYTKVIDYDTSGIWHTAKRAWREARPDVTHHLVLQDDIVLCENFVDIVQGILQNADPEYVDVNEVGFSFCDDIWKMRHAYKFNKGWVYTQMARHAQALMLPITWIEPFITWADYNVRPEYYHDDGRLEMWLRENYMVLHHSVPSLVKHDDYGSVHSHLNGKEILEDKQPYAEYMFIDDLPEDERNERLNNLVLTKSKVMRESKPNHNVTKLCIRLWRT